eukprot:gb/GECH01013300.1/.p1 GENE.gb/GECH01013300.1/~~gb/GECH01013300.1/.p1  ORF type:complete len:259 (+),score=63.09 gb/GECH01013300.1/:1-777(+)
MGQEGKEIFRHIVQRRNELKKHPFLSEFSQRRMNPSSLMSFSPYLFSWVIGFREILTYLYRPQGQNQDPLLTQHQKYLNSVQEEVNHHTTEDYDHWTMFIKDMKHSALRDQSDNFLVSESLLTLFGEFYGPLTRPIRDLVYSLVHEARSSDSPLLRATMVEAMESTYPMFAEATRDFIREQGWYGKMEFFGRTHMEAEMDHAVGSWFQDKVYFSHEVVMTAEEVSKGMKLVDLVYDGFADMFSVFHQIQCRHHAQQQV